MPALEPSDLRPWGSDATVVGPLEGGARNQVVAVVLDRRPAVARRSVRPAPSLDWELDLLDHLAGHGMTVPVAVPTRDGRRHAGGVVVQRRLAGRHPETAADWALVAAELRRLHGLTTGWPQRPGFASSLDLLDRDRGGDVRLDLLPPEGVRVCRAAWRPLAGQPLTVVHGDPGAGNFLLDGDAVGVVDWDESRVDVPLLDLAWLPPDVPVEAPLPRRTLETAALAWETATCWVAEPAYARRRLAELLAATG
jgi:Ser/Thr protein kinase RdoA (MazF antagonist)